MNIYDIAEIAKVSIATVSRVVNGSDKVSESTRKKVLDVIEKVGYTPNVFAQGLGSNTMHTIGILVPTIADHYMSTAVAHLEEELMNYGYDCILSCSGFELSGKQAKCEMLLSKHIDSLILVGSTYAGNGVDTSATDYIREAAKRVPVFIVNGNVNGENIYASVCEDESIVYEVTEKLIERGRKKILFLTDSHSYSSNKKKKGYEGAMDKAGLEGIVVHVENDIHSVKKQLLALDYKPDAIISANDNIAAGAVKYAVEEGLKIPEEIEIIGYNNSILAISSTPEISSIDNHTAEICHDTVERMMHKLYKDGVKLSNKISVPCSLVSRETTKE
ncbi:MAG: LacI family DNA-binding transcriptional regulator [Lachnospiraceae bacterium]|nr:LacI family DNA-binding transcriptional regulator [Lachnospiraceae bacterium]